MAPSVVTPPPIVDVAASGPATEKVDVHTLVRIVGNARQPVLSCYVDDPEKDNLFAAKQVELQAEAVRSGTSYRFEIELRKGADRLV